MTLFRQGHYPFYALHGFQTGPVLVPCVALPREEKSIAKQLGKCKAREDVANVQMLPVVNWNDQGKTHEERKRLLGMVMAKALFARAIAAAKAKRTPAPKRSKTIPPTRAKKTVTTWFIEMTEESVAVSSS